MRPKKSASSAEKKIKNKPDRNSGGAGGAKGTEVTFRAASF